MEIVVFSMNILALRLSISLHVDVFKMCILSITNRDQQFCLSFCTSGSGQIFYPIKLSRV